MRETEFTDYTLREFELTSDSNVSILIYHYFIPCLGICNDVGKQKTATKPRKNYDFLMGGQLTNSTFKINFFLLFEMR